MPIYDYRCPECGGRFERFVRMSEADTTVPCPSYGAAKAVKQLSVFAVGGSGGTASTPSCAPGGG